MGIYLNPGKKSFERAVDSEIYVDKTEMLLYLNSLVNTEQNDVCVSRPRRFGKTMATSVVCAYYDRTADSIELFSGCKVAEHPEWDKFLGGFDVIRLVMTDFMDGSENADDFLDYLTEEVTSELMDNNPGISYGSRISLRTVMNKIYANTGHQFVVVIDEWDAIFRIWKDDKDGQTKYLDFLRDWLKDKDYVALAYMTGILPIKKYGKHSALNMFDEYSMIAPMQFARYTGFTEEEVQELCKQYGRDYERTKDWYDGYVVNDVIPSDPDYKNISHTGKKPEPHRYSLYSPLSVVKAVSSGVVENYWNNTETYEALAEYIRKDFDGLKSTIALLMDGGKAKIDLSTYQNDMTTFSSKDDILALLIHLGYLGFIPSSPEEREKGNYGEVYIPNKEVLEVFRSSTKGDEWTPAFQSFEKSQELVKATWECDEKRVAELLEWFHDQTSNKTYNDESALSYSIQLAYYAAQKYYTEILELDSGRGYADIVYLPAPKYPDKPVLLIELKYDKNTDTAMNQIRKRNYPQRLEHYKDNMLLVSINYDSGIRSTSDDFKHHTCRIEKA